MKHWLFTAALIAASQPGIRAAASTGANTGGNARRPTSATMRPPAPPNPGRSFVSFPGIGLRLLKPVGFTEAENFHGFQQASTQSSVVALRIPGPFSQVTGGFTTAQLKTRGMELRSKEAVKFDGVPGVLLNVRQSAYEIRFMKWIVAFGDESQTFMVTATFPEARQAQLSAALKAVVLSAHRDQTAVPAPGAEAPFTLTASGKLKSTPAIGKMLAFTRDGVLAAKAPEDPLFIAAPSLATVAVADRRAYALQRLHQTASTRVTGVATHEPIRVDELEGYESVAEAQDSRSGVPLVLYQVLLFDGDAYILMQGLVGAQRREEYLPEFQAMARSFRRKPRP